MVDTPTYNLYHPDSPRKNISFKPETIQFNKHHKAKLFIAWYKVMIDNERKNLGLYLSDDVRLEWFGRTIKTRKNVSSFLIHDMHCSNHDFTRVEAIDKIPDRNEGIANKVDDVLAVPLPDTDTKRNNRKRNLRSCGSPEWADGHKSDEINRKRIKTFHLESMEAENGQLSENYEINSKGDGILGRKMKNKHVLVTPPCKEQGQGDCVPSTSSASSERSHEQRSHELLNTQLPKFAVECDAFVQFIRSRDNVLYNNRNIDSMKWDRKCKVQICYSLDPLNVGEYIVWALRYSDESKCRRNLLAAFEAVDDKNDKKSSDLDH